jgi:hypothetical protein
VSALFTGAVAPVEGAAPAVAVAVAVAGAVAVGSGALALAEGTSVGGWALAVTEGAAVGCAVLLTEGGATLGDADAVTAGVSGRNDAVSSSRPTRPALRHAKPTAAITAGWMRMPPRSSGSVVVAGVGRGAGVSETASCESCGRATCASGWVV